MGSVLANANEPFWRPWRMPLSAWRASASEMFAGGLWTVSIALKAAACTSFSAASGGWGAVPAKSGRRNRCPRSCAQSLAVRPCASGASASAPLRSSSSTTAACPRWLAAHSARATAAGLDDMAPDCISRSTVAASPN
eukprot:scaffold36601_cov64-Phaeocystis_antarctica.AAC.1